MELSKVKPGDFKAALTQARSERQHIADATSDPEEMPDDADYYLTPDGASGYGVTNSGTGVGVFSTVKGRGKYLLDHMNHPDGGHAAWFDHFTGHLDSLYEPRGMIEFGRAPNWTPGGPDVVYRVIPSNTDKYPENPYKEYGVDYDPGQHKTASKAAPAPGQSHGVPWADEQERDEMVNEARGV